MEDAVKQARSVKVRVGKYPIVTPVRGGLKTNRTYRYLALSLGWQSDITVGGTFTARSVKAREESLHSKEAVVSIQEAGDAEEVLYGPGLPEAFKQQSRFPM